MSIYTQCPRTENSNQANNDDDSFGDACDGDDDDDGILDADDNCPFDPNPIESGESAQADNDGDGMGDVCDPDDDDDGILDAFDNVQYISMVCKLFSKY